MVKQYKNKPIQNNIRLFNNFKVLTFFHFLIYIGVNFIKLVSLVFNIIYDFLYSRFLKKISFDFYTFTKKLSKRFKALKNFIVYIKQGFISSNTHLKKLSAKRYKTFKTNVNRFNTTIVSYFLPSKPPKTNNSKKTKKSNQPKTSKIAKEVSTRESVNLYLKRFVLKVNASYKTLFNTKTSSNLNSNSKKHKSALKTSKKKSTKKIEKSVVRVNKSKSILNPIKNTNTVFTKYKYIGIFVFGILFGLIFVAVPFEVYKWFKQLPKPELLAQNQPKSTKIVDRKGRLLYEIYVDKKYEPVSLTLVPEHVIQATIAIEDSEFYNHRGVRLDSIIRAVKANISGEVLQGGSTITQQLIKNVLLTPDRTFERKIKEGVLALMVEREYSKEEILGLYLNNIPYGGTSWGIQSASNTFFGKDVSSLTLAEAALLAGLPNAPSVYSPFSGSDGLAKQRQAQVLNRMVTLGYISKTEAEKALAEDIQYISRNEYIRAPHFVSYVREELVEKYGDRYVNFGGLTVTTTLDLDIQDKVQQIVTSEVENSKALNISNGASIVLDTKTSEIIAYVGSKDYFEDNVGAYDILRAYRQPGSSIKPLTYVLALENGATPATLIDDSPLTIKTEGETYTPKNYDGKFHGRVTLRQALANSYNIPAVKVIRSVGADNLVKLGQSMGFKNWEVDNTYGLSITLGGKETRLIDLANAYATFGRLGMYKKVEPILSVKDANGFEMYNKDTKAFRVLSEGSTYILSHILSDNAARVPAFGSNSALVIPERTVAVKTGTTDENRDNLTLGYTPSYTVGVWVGNNDNSPMNRRLVSGLSGAAPIWNKVMTSLLVNKEDEPFYIPPTIFVKVDTECNNKSEVFIEGTAPEKLCPRIEKVKVGKL